MPYRERPQGSIRRREGSVSRLPLRVGFAWSSPSLPSVPQAWYNSCTVRAQAIAVCSPCDHSSGFAVEGLHHHYSQGRPSAGCWSIDSVAVSVAGCCVCRCSRLCSCGGPGWLCGEGAEHHQHTHALWSGPSISLRHVACVWRDHQRRDVVVDFFRLGAHPSQT